MIITQTPLRISFAGGGTDFSGFYLQETGRVLSTALDKYLFVIVKQRFDNKIYVNYSQKEIVDHIDDLQHELVRETMRKTGVLDGVEITTLADIPSEGSGLGSSSSITVGLLNALYAYQGEQVPAERLAQEACEIEIDILGKPIGVQDQYIAAYGGLRLFTFGKDGTVQADRVEMTDTLRRRFSNNLMLFFTDRTRQSSAILEEQKTNIKDTNAVLCQMRDQALEAKAFLEAGRVDAMGALLDRGWQLKKSLASRISDDELDDMYNRAREAGALGGKISGAGGGGFLLLYCPPDRQDAVAEALADYREMPFALERDGSKVIFNVRREGWLKE
ncbi:MAG: GHMP kinase [Candidatus Latescibacteria bacterium]|nr:GHMP kinase [Candidatus Latescibacterota bacterium]MBT5829362.1 GHMP kinase [Candidatus Latescibacterota bacterium]